MNEKNAQFLKERMLFLGFGENLNAEMEKKIKEKPDQFNLSIQGEFGSGDKKKIVDYDLDFTRSKKEDMYFVNNYTATLRDDNPEKEKSQKFYLNYGSGVTAKEAFNLLEGRAVYKTKLKNREGNQYNSWQQLNFSEKDKNDNFKVQPYHDNWKYDLEKSLDKHPIKQLNDAEQKADLIKSLQKGNVQQVTFVKGDKETKMFLEANPKDKNIIVYDQNMQKQSQGIRLPSKEVSERQSIQNTDKGSDPKGNSQGDLGRGADGKDVNQSANQKQENSATMEVHRSDRKQRSAKDELKNEDAPSKKKGRGMRA